MSNYTFGDDASARERLRLVASAYEPVSRQFIAGAAEVQVETAVDLGCGPGYSTALLGDVVRPRALVGVDASEQFLDGARRLVPRATFVAHDVTEAPLPSTPADLIYARLLLAHLPDPAAAAELWREQLTPGGRLLVEDLEGIDAPSGALRRYEEVSTEMVRRGGGVMYAGAELKGLGGRTAPVTVPAELAARIYLFNVRRWRDDPAQAERHHSLLELEAELEEIANRGAPGPVTWFVRQIVLGG